MRLLLTKYEKSKENEKRFFQFLLLVTFTGVVFSSCKKGYEEEDNTPTQNIVEIAQGNGDFSILVQALT